MPLKSGYGQKTVRDNIEMLMKEGYARNQAIAIALTNARKAYQRKFPQGYLPSYLRVKSNPRNGGLSNFEKVIAELQAARRDLESENLRQMSIDEDSTQGALSRIGELVGVIYAADGENYIHQFKKANRPILAVNEDGTQLHIVGGQYVVTERGIEDA